MVNIGHTFNVEAFFFVLHHCSLVHFAMGNAVSIAMQVTPVVTRPVETDSTNVQSTPVAKKRQKPLNPNVQSAIVQAPTEGKF